MSQTAIQTSPDPTPGVEAPLVPQTEGRTAWQWVKTVLTPIASLKVTVVLFALSLFLVFAGTLAQKEIGMWTAVDTYFRSAFVWIPFQLFVRFGQIFFRVPETVSLGGSFPFPGGWLLGGLLLANLLAAHTVRFKMTWKRSGILLIHAGLVVMMLSELVTGLFAVEANMTLVEGETVDFVDLSREAFVRSPIELALTDSSDADFDDVVVVPGPVLKKSSRIQNDKLPVDIEILEYMDNSDLVPEENAPNDKSRTFVSAVGARFKLMAKPEEPGTSERRDAPAVRVRFLRKGTEKPLGGEYVLSLCFDKNLTGRRPVHRFPPQRLRVDDKKYIVELRPKRVYKPYAIHLNKFTHKRYVGTETPKDYASEVRLIDPSRNEDREVRIWMNHPLRHAGDSLYQAGVLDGGKGTVLQVVENPGWLMPYVSCAMVTLGLLIHFGLHLTAFLRRRFA
jgi:hypothetical protein